MSSFDDILAQPLPSQRHLFESAEDEKKEEKDKEVDRQAIVDAIGEVLDDFEDIEADTDDFLSGDEDKIEIDDADDDFIKKLKSALKDYKEIEIEKDDDEVTISLKQESVEDFINSLDFFGESEEDNSDLSEDGEEDDMSEDGEDDNSADIAEGTDDMEEFGEDDEAKECGSQEECGDTDLDEDFGEDDDDDEDDEDEDIDNSLDDLEDQSQDDIETGLMNADDGSEENEDLTPAEDQKADDMLAMVATPMLIKDELTAEESVNFYESADSDIAVDEGLIMESDLDEIFTEGVFASPNRPFKMTKKARFKQLYELSVQIEARAHRDPKMKQLDRAYKIERKIKAELRNKYGTAAKKRAMIYLKRLMKSKSSVLKNLGRKMLPKK